MHRLLADAQALSPEIARVRHALHRQPEIGLDLPHTQATVLRELEGLGLEITLGKALSSVTAVLRGGAVDRTAGAPRSVLLRADMDALPVQEDNDLPFKSEIDGRMHACGHDLHVAMLLGAARLLHERRESLAGDVVFMFQPGEESPGGAPLMIEEGVLDASGRRVDAAYALHVFSAGMPFKQFAARRGAMLAAADDMKVTLHGRGGHGSAPQKANDPVPVLAEVVLALQTMVTRKFDVFDPVVISVGHIAAGSANNVIPGTAMLHCTLRSFSVEARARLRSAAEQLVHGIAQAHGMTAEIDYHNGYPVTYTEPSHTDFAAEIVGELFGSDRYTELDFPFVGAEDFSYVLEQVPGSFIALGATPPTMDPETAPYNHAAQARYDDAVLADGTALYAALALRHFTR